MKLLSNRNAKLRKDGIKSFGLPSVKTCPFAGACKQYCYASNGCYRFSNVVAAQEARFKLTRTAEFTAAMATELKPGGVVRIHDSGDFYSKAYVAKWVALATRNPYTYFYAYTKSVQYFKNINLPANFRVIYSFGGKCDPMIDTRRDYHAVVFKNREELRAAGYADSSESDMVAATGRSRKIGLLMH